MLWFSWSIYFRKNLKIFSLFFVLLIPYFELHSGSMSLVFMWIIIIYFSRIFRVPGAKMHLNYCLFNLVFWLQKWMLLYLLVSDGKLWKHTVSIALYNVHPQSFLCLVSNSRALSMTFFPLVFFYLYCSYFLLVVTAVVSLFVNIFLHCCCYCMFKITLLFFLSRQKAKTNNKLMPF